MVSSTLDHQKSRLVSSTLDHQKSRIVSSTLDHQIADALLHTRTSQSPRPLRTVFPRVRLAGSPATAVVFPRAITAVHSIGHRAMIVNQKPRKTAPTKTSWFRDQHLIPANVRERLDKYRNWFSGGCSIFSLRFSPRKSKNWERTTSMILGLNRSGRLTDHDRDLWKRVRCTWKYALDFHESGTSTDYDY